MANQDFAQLFFFVALLIVLASIVFASTLRPMEIIRGVAKGVITTTGCDAEGAADTADVGATACCRQASNAKAARATSSDVL